MQDFPNWFNKVSITKPEKNMTWKLHIDMSDEHRFKNCNKMLGNQTQKDKTKKGHTLWPSELHLWDARVAQHNKSVNFDISHLQNEG